MNIYYSPHFIQRLKKRIKKNPKLKSKIHKQVKLFRSNPIHPSLRLHKLKGKRLDQYSFWIEGDLRIAFVKKIGDIIFTDILTHDEY